MCDVLYDHVCVFSTLPAATAADVLGSITSLKARKLDHTNDSATLLKRRCLSVFTVFWLVFENTFILAYSLTQVGSNCNQGKSPVNEFEQCM